MSVNVKASFRTGSFGVDLSMAHNAIHDVLMWLSSREGTGLGTGVGILTELGILGKHGAIPVLKKLAGRKITKVEVDPAGYRILTEDGEKLIVEQAVLALLQDRLVRENLDRVLSPLDRDGIDQVAFGNDHEIFEVVKKDERRFFAVPPSQDALLFSNERVQAFSIVSLAFKEDNMWRLNDGQATIHATIEDIDFMERVNNNDEAFSKGDVLICRVAVTQWQTEKGVRTEYVVKEIQEHQRASRQIPLDFRGLL